jgi:hypothetical protein
MANGSTAHEHIETVKKTCDGLECSPSHHSPTSPIAFGGSKAVGHGVKQTTGVLKHGTTRPKPRGSKVSGPKKDHMHQKSTGR